MTLVDILQNQVWLFVSLVVIFGLLVGSFLNVVIHRLPLMMEQEWLEQCEDLSGIASSSSKQKLTLSSPRSRCPHCQHQISAIENIPVISFLFLKGKCKACGQTISFRYPTIELITGILSGVIAWKFGFDWNCAGALLLTWSFIALTAIDFDHQLLPDKITLPLLWVGIFFNLFHIYTDLYSSVIGAIAGYMSLWLVFHAFRILTGKEGMGYGDFKLLAVIGAWLGWQLLPIVVLLSSVVGAIVGISLIILKKHQREVPIPFGPYLAAAGWIALVSGSELNQMYLVWIGLN